MDLPFSKAAENNKAPIFNVLKRTLSGPCHVLEIGSGTGQHISYFAEQMKDSIWQASDQAENIPAIQARIDTNPLSNLPKALTLDASQPDWPTGFDHIYTANTFHIMPWPVVQRCLKFGAKHLPLGGYFFVYGPFKYAGEFTTSSNQAFDAHLRNWVPHQGIRNFEDVIKTADQNGLSLQNDVAMPANNQLLVLQKTTR